MQDLKSKFPEDEYVWLEGEGKWLYLIDREHKSIRLFEGRARVLQAFLEKSDARGVVRWGDLSGEVQSAALEFLESSAWAMKAMGDSVGNVRLALQATVYVEAEVAGKAVGYERFPKRDLKLQEETDQVLRQNAIAGIEVTPALIAELNEESRVKRGKEYGVSMRFIGVNPYSTTIASAEALSALAKYLRDHEDRVSPLYAGLEEKYISSGFDMFGGRLPQRPLSKDQVPELLWDSLTRSIRSDVGVNGLANEVDAEKFINGITSVRLRASYAIRYFVSSYADSRGNTRPAQSMGVLLVRH